ncbi:caspase family protein [Sinorhizobium fredii]|uniref:Peptidase C14 caspase family protein n=1 Tax=Rhizobium fredii TaxID=380 RepID=A0A2L0HBB6_RHIFR|nr:caspase family protein [Sinorhizobium fredii]AUX78707.1 peptidase C14 caspase family protein [Sinorhizobium fredii]
MSSKSQALVIGNGNYSGPLRLNSPGRDADEVAKSFRSLKIDVDLLIDANFEQITATIDAFLERVSRPSTLVSILYYSGHGIQIDGENYIIPVDFDQITDGNLARLISVQKILDRMTCDSAVRIVLLDACRSNATARQFIGGKDLSLHSSKKEFKIGGNTVIGTGLAEIKATSNTFIAFAAAPGDVAYEGELTGELSPFTSSFVKNLDAVDLPISNLTSRIRSDVLRSTEGRQRTWDQSSLMAPFYFNPGSLLLFAGNFMALVGLFLSLAIYSCLIAESFFPREMIYVVGATMLPLVALCILLFGVQSVYSRLRGNVSNAPRITSERWALSLRSLQKGLLGGYLGSLLAAPTLSALYYYEWDFPHISLGQLMVEITYGTAFAACPLGGTTIFCAGVGRQLRFSKFAVATRVFLGSCVGGAVAGGLTAPFLTYYFGIMENRPQMTPERLLPGSILGAAFIVLSIVNFDFERLTRRRVWASIASAFLAIALGAAMAVVVFAPLYLMGIVHAVIAYLEARVNDPWGMMKGGFIYGLPTGLVLGAVIGSAIVLTERLSGKMVAS